MKQLRIPKFLILIATLLLSDIMHNIYLRFLIRITHFQQIKLSKILQLDKIHIAVQIQ